jgi:hypothetical protein
VSTTLGPCATKLSISRAGITGSPSRYAFRSYQHIGFPLIAGRGPAASLRHQRDVGKREPQPAKLGAEEVEVDAVDDVREVEPVRLRDEVGRLLSTTLMQ